MKTDFAANWKIEYMSFRKGRHPSLITDEYIQNPYLTLYSKGTIGSDGSFCSIENLIGELLQFGNLRKNYRTYMECMIK